jgi:hypothetical protein
MTPDNHFVLEAFDVKTRCVALDAHFKVMEVGEIVELLQTKPDFQRGYPHWLDAKTLALIKSRFGIHLESGDMPVSLRVRHKLDALPYKIHTNRELLLMLSGSKPLSFFCSSVSNPSDEDIPEELFDAYVKLGAIKKAERVDALNPMSPLVRNRNVLYALPAEEWRFAEFFTVLEKGRLKGWTEELTRRQGTLLGYEDWQNDAFIEMVFKPGIANKKISMPNVGAESDGEPAAFGSHLRGGAG